MPIYFHAIPDTYVYTVVRIILIIQDMFEENKNYYKTFIADFFSENVRLKII